MVNAQNYLNQWYPSNGVCQVKFPNISLVSSCSFNHGKRRSEIKSLDIWAIENLEGPLSLKGFYNLEEFNCWGNNITELDLSDCSKLKILNCSKNKLTKICLNNYSNLRKLDWLSNKVSGTQALQVLSIPQSGSQNENIILEQRVIQVENNVQQNNNLVAANNGLSVISNVSSICLTITKFLSGDPNQSN